MKISNFLFLFLLPSAEGGSEVGSRSMSNDIALDVVAGMEDVAVNGNCTTTIADDEEDLGNLYLSPTPVQRLDALGRELGVAQTLDTNNMNEVIQRIEDGRHYMRTIVNMEEKYTDVREGCKNQHESCAFWASLGECEKNPNYMKAKCGPVCQSCDFLSVETRCPLDPDAVDALYPGDVTKVFNRIQTDPSLQKYQPKIMSRPTYLEGDTQETADYQIGPWMVVFDSAITDEEADRLIELGGIEGYERSADVGKKLADGTYDKKVYAGRTSTNAWCQNECYDDPIAKRVMERVENITGIAETNSEWLQLLRYEKGQHYNRHHDLIGHQAQRQCGVRIFTLYFYLDDVEEGGGTNFPELNLTVTPKRGRAVLWPSVYDHDPNVADPRTEHAALPVIKGVKYGANAWIHQRDFKGPHRNGCT